MGCADGSCCAKGAGEGTISFPDTFSHDTPWKFYNHLIGGIPEDILVIDYALGRGWSYLTAECGTGVAYTASGGGKRTYTDDLRGMQLRDVAELAKSWCFEEATLGVAALNAWYSRPELLDPLGATYDEPVEFPDGTVRKMDAFELYRPEITAMSEAGEGRGADGRANVVVVGHFPHVDRIEEYANLCVLERKPSGNDTPDPGCEYVIPHADFAFITGVTIINKTAPRLLDLCKAAGTRLCMVGPSVVMSPFLFQWGVETLAGSVVNDPEKVRFTVTNGAGKFFGEALRMTQVTQK